MSQTETEFLNNYDRNAYVSPLATVDAAIFTFWQDDLYVLLTKRSEHPEKGRWALPGGFVDEQKDKALEDTVVRSSKKKPKSLPHTLNSSAPSETKNAM